MLGRQGLRTLQRVSGSSRGELTSFSPDSQDLEDDDLSGLSDDDDVAAANPMVDMQALAEKDPAFYKFLQENDPDLLKFNADAAGDVDMSDESEEDDEEEAGSKKKSKKAKKAKDVKGKGKESILTKEVLREWQKAILEVRRITRGVRHKVVKDDETDGVTAHRLAPCALSGNCSSRSVRLLRPAARTQRPSPRSASGSRSTTRSCSARSS